MRTPEELARAIALLDDVISTPPPAELAFMEPLAKALRETLAWASGEDNPFEGLLTILEYQTERPRKAGE